MSNERNSISPCHSGATSSSLCPLSAGDTDAADQLRAKGDCQERDAPGNPPPEPGTFDGGGRSDVGKLGGTPRAPPLSPAATLPKLHLRPCK